MNMKSMVGVTLAAASVAGGAVLSPAAASTAPAVRQASSKAFVNECYRTKPLAAPQKFLLACGDGNGMLTNLTWRHWGWTIANAKGMVSLNDCQPYCAAGHFRSYPVLVSVSHVAKAGSNRYYTQLTYRFTGKVPQGLQRLAVVKLPS